MKLAECLKKFNEDDIVAIGAKNGSNFMYIGRAGDTDLIEKVFNNYLKATKRRQTTAFDALSRLLSEPLVNDEGDKKWSDKVLSKAYEVSKRRNSYFATKNYISQYVPVMERDVVEGYRKEVDNCKAILVEGLEQGDFWTRDEFVKKYGK